MATVCIHVFQGDRVELLPALCMFCGTSLGEEPFQLANVQIRQTARK